MDEGMPIGFISERDLVRKALNNSLSELEKKSVGEIMTRDMIIGMPDDDIAYVSSIMIKNKIRHLPILQKKEIVGLVSIGDVVDAQISDDEFENRMLHDYIEGKYPG
jgi:CBS domain-containing protein